MDKIANTNFEKLETLYLRENNYFTPNVLTFCVSSYTLAY